MPGRCEDKAICCFIQREFELQSVMAHGISSRYCDSDKDKCARYMVKSMIMRGYTLPNEQELDSMGCLLIDLHPSDTDGAMELIGLMVK